jgi:hypothetical protein
MTPVRPNCSLDILQRRRPHRHQDPRMASAPPAVCLPLVGTHVLRSAFALRGSR